MSHGPCGLCGAALDRAPACAAIVNVTPLSVSASASIGTRSILVFMFILFVLPGYNGIWNFHGFGDVMQVNQSA
jgi:hypothetical protein